ncbi:hypothetical protein [Paludisphaera mucosa]|uniref:Uncharacterized protein n=1 Tax=Paludisphaera mucosa TaxID=3030827 RepID=A0ABT6FD16_9BACT|nr:hypothetical protein [Paludisphaera mucosa]MDG3005476.1 hypothetical protein [Paludisphaera mucosa]
MKDPRPGPEGGEATARKRAAYAGDVDAVWNELVSRDVSLFGLEDAFEQLGRAIEVRCGGDPARFAAETFARMISFTTYMMMRCSFYINTRISGAARSRRQFGPSEPPQDVSESLLPRLLDIQEHVAGLLEAQARVARLWTLADAKRDENARAARRYGEAPAADPPEAALDHRERPDVAPVDRSPPYWLGGGLRRGEDRGDG